MNLVLLLVYFALIAVFYLLIAFYSDPKSDFASLNTLYTFWIIKNTAGFLCFLYMCYVMLAQYGRVNPRALTINESELDKSGRSTEMFTTDSSEDREEAKRQKMIFRDLLGPQVR